MGMTKKLNKKKAKQSPKLGQVHIFLQIIKKRVVGYMTVWGEALVTISNVNVTIGATVCNPLLVAQKIH